MQVVLRRWRNRPRLWCDQPEAGARVGAELVVKGWAVSAADVREVSICCPDGTRVNAVYGLSRPDVRAAIAPDARSDELGWVLRLDTRAWPRGVQQLTIEATDARGRSTRTTRSIEVQPERRYHEWLAQRRHPAPPERSARFLVCVLGGQADASELSRTRASLEAQSYEHWTVLEHAADPGVALDRLLAGDEEYVVFVAAGDLLEPHALATYAECVSADPAAQLMYADEDRWDSERSDPFFKPAWSPELLLCEDYVGPFFALDRSAARLVRERDPEPLRSTYDVLLALVDEDLDVCHVPDVLVSRPADLRPAPPRPLAWVGDEPKVSIIVSSDGADGCCLARCLESITARTTWSNYELIVVAHGAAAEQVQPDVALRFVSYKGPLNRSAIRNAGARVATGEHLLFVDDAVEVASPDWIQALVAAVHRPGVCVAGAKLVSPNGTIQFAGAILADEAHPVRVLGENMPDGPGYRGLFAVARNTSSVCGSALLVRKDAFVKLGGFDAELVIELGDVDLCLRSLSIGRRVVWTPNAVLIDHRRRAGQPWLGRDHVVFRKRWDRAIRAGDPYHNPNFEERSDRQFEVRDTPGAPPLHRRPRLTVDPTSVDGPIPAQHDARYRWVADLLAGKDVLDAGCGVGHGTRMCIDAGANVVVGVDASAEAVAVATERLEPAAQVLRADLGALPFSSRSFDVVLCFEAMERAVDPGGVLDELKRVLREGGVMILSSRQPRLHDALCRRFANVRMFDQKLWFASLIADTIDGRGPSIALCEDAAVAPATEVCTLVVAGDGPLPALGQHALLTGGTQDRQWMERAWRAEAQAAVARTDLSLAAAKLELERVRAEGKPGSCRGRRLGRRIASPLRP